MRHRKAGRKLGRNTNQRQALIKGLIRSLILNERLNTTEAKAKTIMATYDHQFSLDFIFLVKNFHH